MKASVTILGFRHSVYQRVARIALHEKNVEFRVKEVDPFDPEEAERLRDLHPFGRVPVLRHGSFDLYETSAITRYVDAAFDGPRLVPEDPRAAARMAQAIAVVDAYGYWPMIRQVFARRVFAPNEDSACNEAEVARGLAASRTVIEALEAIAADGRILTGDAITLADCHLGAMMDYFTRAPEGAALIQSQPHLDSWWRRMRARPSITGLDQQRR
ncbi:glutathione S-transferase family protein [Palleronia sediminis]|uniref:glutathione transferase n=1 Tax=Palleronia sediminis TaxID=2547833 RepID=A0A4R5ZT67_9RHOB|nr:glutathione S-transferase family protein [Palleronia sediminis]TDL74140.1 glutathione S-transferase family protein [Palleronia sediminis]